MNQKRKVDLASLIFMAVLLSLILSLVLLVPGAFVLLELGRLVGPIVPPVLIISITVAAGYLQKRTINHSASPIRQIQHLSVVRARKKRKYRIIFASLLASVIIVSFLSAGFLFAVQKSATDIRTFVAKNANETLQDYDANLNIFLNANLRSCYNKPEMIYKYYEAFLGSNYISFWLMNASGTNFADYILFQGWSACGEAAILLQQIMHDSGYMTRLAEFKGVDHEWAEVRNGTQWLIVDPWYIGNLTSIQDLKSLNPNFQHATGVQVQYYGVLDWVDDSKEHGY